MTIIRKASFTCRENGHNKEYHFQLIDNGDGQHVINFQYGAIGQSLKLGTKTAIPVTLEKANKMFESMIKERLSKGYTGGENSDSKAGFTQSSPNTSNEPKKVYILPQLLNAIYLNEVEKLINDDNFLAQEKKDGERRLVDSGDTFKGLNKKGQEVQLPDSILNSLPVQKVVLDGEIITGHHVFDILSLNGKDLKSTPLTTRLEMLQTLNFGPAIEIVKSYHTTQEKQELFDRLKSENKEGIVFKRKSGLYKAGRPNSGGDQFKFKFQNTASFIVDNITEGKRSVGLVLLNDKQERIPVGKCTIPPNKEIPKVGDIVEVQYLYAYPNGGSIFQPVYINKRNDIDAEECVMSQLVYKTEEQ